MSIKSRLFTWFILVSVIPLLVIGGFSYYLIFEKISKQNEETITNINKGIYNMVDTQQKVLSRWLESAAAFFIEKLNLLGPSRFDYDNIVEIGGYRLPTWYIGNQKISGDNTLVDTLIEKEKLPASIFQFHNNKFIRVSSNVRQPDGNRIVGTLLEAGPVYDRLINGQQYLGRANVEGIMHATIYQPIFDSDGKLIGAFVLGRREQEYELLNAIKNIVVGETGYVSVIDPEGNFIIHPSLQGKSILNYPWASEVLQKKNGSITYDLNGQKKIAYYMYYEPWNWYILTSGYTSELFNTTRELSLMLALACLSVIALSAFIAYILANSFFRPINELMEVMRQGQSGNLTARLHHSFNDEFRLVSNALNAMLNNMALLIGRILSNATKLKEASHNLLDDITESKEALKSMETGVTGLRQSVQSSSQTAAAGVGPGEDVLHALEEIKTLLSQVNTAVKNKQYDDLSAIQLSLEKLEFLRRKIIALSTMGPENLMPSYSISLQNKLSNLEVELAKLKLLIKHISSSASSLDDIAMSLDRHVHIFKVEEKEEKPVDTL
jgi:methyl-accepting chemotaxis protein